MVHTDKPLVSVIVPAYKAQEHIAGTIRSVQNQTLTEWELIVIDDCSPDATSAVIAELARQDPRIRPYRNEQNLGVAKSRNRGLQLCRGRYAAFLDSDDTWRPDKLRLQLERMRSTGAALAYTAYAIVGADGSKQCADFLVPTTVSFEELLKENVIGCSTVVLDLSQLPTVNFEETFFHEDYVLWLKLLRDGHKAVGVPEVLVDYYFHPDSKAGNKWNAAQKRWTIYRQHLGLSLLKSGRYFLHYSLAGLKKYRRIRQKDPGCTEGQNAALPASTATLQQHQAVLYELLQVFDTVCKKHNIQYMLFAGTALGAVRHGGFIPWDDDLDVVMLRSEYERFIALAPAELDAEKYYLQSEGSPHWPLFFSKLRRNGTTCLERYVPRDPQIHQGVYIDIFPCDNLAGSRLLQKLQFAASKIVIAKALDKRGYLTDRLSKKCFIWLCRLLPAKPFRWLAQLPGKNTTAQVHTFFGGAVRYEKSVFPREWFCKTVPMSFEDGEYPISACYDALLTRLYGDYMTPLSPEERGCKVHADFVDLEHPYTDYPDYQKRMHISEYSRSIR